MGDLPAVEKDCVNHNDEDIYVSFTSKEREVYATDVLEYLKLQNFKYLGTRGEQKNTLAGVFTTYYFEPADTLESFRVIEGDYVFVFSDGSTDENGDVEFNILIIYSESVNTLEYENKKFTYNTRISLRQGSEAPLGGFYVLKEEEHEHTITYVPAGESGHFENYTCGCPHDHGAVSHHDENMDLICDACGYDMNEDCPPLVDETVSLTQFVSWLTELNAENVAEIKTTFEYVGVAPGRLKDISRTTDKTVIADVLDKYASTDMRPVAREDTYIEGGSAFTIEFTLTDGTVKQLYFNNGFYAYGLYEDEISALCYFELCSIPTLKDYDNIAKSNGFITYLGTGTVYDKDNKSVCEISMDELEFIITDYDSGLFVNGYDCCIDTEFGKLHFVKVDIFVADE